MGSGRDSSTAPLRALPAVHELAARLDAPHAVAVAAARSAIEEQRAALLDGAQLDASELHTRAAELARELSGRSLRPVINASGVVLHTNLGRAPLSEAARRAVAEAARGYSNLELDLSRGTRGSRQDHTRELLCELTGADDALV